MKTATAIRNIKSILVMAVAIAVLVSLIAQLHSQAAETVNGNHTIVSVNNVDGYGGNANSNTQNVSTDGSTVVFSTSATNLAGISAAGMYAKNLKTGVSLPVHVSTAGVTANGAFQDSKVSENGRYVAFTSFATNLIDGYTLPVGQTYLRDTQVGTTTLITGTPGVVYHGNTTTYTDQKDFVSGVSNDGRYVLVESKVLARRIFGSSAHLGYYDTLVYDTKKATWTLVNMPSSGNLSDLQVVESHRARMSCDGSFIVFQSSMNNLVPGANGSPAIYLADLRSGAPQLSQISPSGNHAKISCNGNYIIYATSGRTEITPTPSGMANGDQIIRYNRLTGEKQYISSNSAGTYNKRNNNGGSGPSVIVPDWSMSQIADSGDAIFTWSSSTTAPRHVYLKHLSDGSGTLEHVKKTVGGTYVPFEPSFSQFPSNPRLWLSSDARNTIYTDKTFNLGITPTDSGFYDVIRSETGLNP